MNHSLFILCLLVLFCFFSTVVHKKTLLINRIKNVPIFKCEQLELYCMCYSTSFLPPILQLEIHQGDAWDCRVLFAFVLASPPYILQYFNEWILLTHLCGIWHYVVRSFCTNFLTQVASGMFLWPWCMHEVCAQWLCDWFCNGHIRHFQRHFQILLLLSG